MTILNWQSDDSNIIFLPKAKKKKKSVTSTDADVLPYKYFKISLSQPPDFQ